jgi:aspartate dehydrogenase
MKLGVIGCGALAQTMFQALASSGVKLDRLVCLVPEHGISAAREKLAHFDFNAGVTHDPSELLGCRPDLVVECASQQAVHDYGRMVLDAAIDFGLISVGALSDGGLHEGLLAAASASGARLHIVPGAVGGIDVLAAARLSGLEEVAYTSRKPPSAWRGTPAADILDLDSLTEAQVFFSGAARVAAKAYPQNANVAATIALAGIGFDRTLVHLVADPAVLRNVHELRFVSGCADVSIRLEGRVSPDNPKTSLTAGYSLARFVLNHVNREVV